MSNRNLSVDVDSGLVIAIGASTVEQTGIQPGRLYRFTAVGAGAVVRWGADDASAADGGFDFAVAPNDSVYARAPTGVTAVNAITAVAATTGNLFLSIAKETDTV